MNCSVLKWLLKISVFGFQESLFSRRRPKFQGGPYGGYFFESRPIFWLLYLRLACNCEGTDVGACYQRFWKAPVRVREIRTIQTAGANACPLELRDTRAGTGLVLPRCRNCLFCYNILAPVPITFNNLFVRSRNLVFFSVSVAINMWVPIPAMLQAMWYFQLRSSAKFENTGAGHARFPWCRYRCRYSSICWYMFMHQFEFLKLIPVSFL